MTPVPSLEELIGAVNEQSGSDDRLERLATAVLVSEEVTALADALLNHFVQEARENGASWSQVGDALGVTKQGAQQRFCVRPSELRLGKLRELKIPQAARRLTLVSARSLLEQSRGPIAAFTPRAKRAVLHAAEEAARLCHDYVGTEHLLLGILRDRRCLAVRVLRALEVSPQELRDAVLELVGPGDPKTEGEQASLPFTPRARKVLMHALREAAREGHDHVGTEHLLVGLVAEGHGIGGQVLLEAGVDVETLREKVRQEVGD